MLDFISKLVTAVISPLGTSLLLGVLALLLGALARKRLATYAGTVALVWLYLWSTPLASIWLRGLVEGPPSDGQIEELPVADAVVVLGGGVAPPQTSATRPNLADASDRVWYGAALYHAGKAPLIVLSGGSDPETTVMTEADAMLWLLRDLGVPETAILVETGSRNTAQNAEFTAKLLGERGLRRILLVTSALHMQRAQNHFQAEGLTVVQAPTDFEARPVTTWRSLIPDTDALDGSARAIKELVGQAIQ